jgi:electron transport complex protein RnfB
MTESLADRIDALLPQTQCRRCGYAACRPYAEAIARGEAPIDRCPPGGANGVAALAALTGDECRPLDPECGRETPPQVALIDEAVCIGCTKCIQACPVDAIVGAPRRMHTVISAECTGCELCIPPCPVDCIALVATRAVPLARPEILVRAARARSRFLARERRLAPARVRADARRPGAAPRKPAPISRDAVLAAIARGRARRIPGGGCRE